MDLKVQLIKFEMVREGSREVMDWVSPEGWYGETKGLVCLLHFVGLHTEEKGGHFSAWAEHKRNEIAILHTEFPLRSAFLQGKGELP